MYYPERDVLGVTRFQQALIEFQPDLVYMTADAGTATALAANLPTIPSLLYVPIEGEPLGNYDWRRLVSSLPVVTCSQYGADIIKRDTGKTVPYVYHGVDHDVFRAYSPEEREETRRKLGWDDKFIVTAVAQNVRRKQLPRLIEAVSILRYKYKVTDIYLYLHTVPFQQYWLDGHNLQEITDMFGVSDITIFNSELQNRNDSIPETDYQDEQGRWRPGLVSIYNASDLYVNPSQVEGFGLPIAEAMACGTPVLVTKYAAGWEVATPAGRGIPVRDWEIHKSATKYANVDVGILASEILRFKRSGVKERERMSKMGIERAKDFTWSPFHEMVVEQAEESIRAYKERRSKGQKTGTGQVPRKAKDAIRRDEGNDTGEESPTLIKRSVEDIERQEKTNPFGPQET